MTQILTDKKNRALCLNYRNGKRCRRLARIEACWTDSHITHHMAMCEDCAKSRNAEIVQRSQKGFTVTTSQLGSAQRFYHSIDERDTELGQQRKSDIRSYAEEVAVGDLIAQNRDWERWVTEDNNAGGRYDVPLPESFKDS